MQNKLNSIVDPLHQNLPKYIFAGRILPEFPSLDMSEPLLYRFEGYDSHTAYGCITIKQSLIQAIVMSDNQDIPTLRNHVAAQTRIILDAFGYVNGYYFFVDLQSLSSPDETYIVFNTSYEALAKKAAQRPFDVTKLTVLSQDETLRLALSDTRNAMEFPLETGLFSYRAVETIMQSFKIGADSDGQGWLKMHTALHTTKGFIEQNIKAFADERRHGKISFITGEQRDTCLLAATEIIDRYCIYLDRNKQPLNQQEFPSLVPGPI